MVGFDALRYATCRTGALCATSLAAHPDTATQTTTVTGKTLRFKRIAS
jgi:hypothetical protein